jgi:photosystem II stability/assembly factor-like uncharacterized protein/DNA-binding beta-propeller fold protein YncE
MKKQILAVVVMALPILLIACSGSSDPAAIGFTVPVGSASLAHAQPGSPTAEITAGMKAETTPSGDPSSAPPGPGIPRLIDQIYLGVPAGNGHTPYRVAVDSQQRRAYTLNQGLASLDRGNTISVLDLETRQVTHLIRLHNMRAEAAFPPDPLDLQVDPYRPRLYAVWGNRYSETVDSSLTVLDADTLAIVDTLPGVEALAVGPDRLYLANDNRLWNVDPDSLVERGARALEPRTFNQPLLINPEQNRLYLGRGNPQSLEVFEADSLSPVASYAMAGRIIRAVVDTQTGRIYSLESDGQQVLLRSLDADGRPLDEPAAVPLGDDVYSDFPLALDGQTLYVAQADYPDYRLHAFALPNLSRLDSLPLGAQPYDLAADRATGFLYAAYSSWSDYVLAIDPGNGATEAIYTALALSDALADTGGSRLYVLDDSGRLRVLSLAAHKQVAQVDTGYNLMQGRYTGYGQLSLDPSRERLYIGGDPVRIVSTDSLTVTASLHGRGQVTADPGGERLYLTPPCNCRIEQCNTLILDAETLTGTRRLFPPQDPMTAPCVEATRLDSENQLLYAQIYNGVPGSNSGSYYSVFDVGDRPEELFSAFDISFGQVAIDPLRARAFASRYRINRTYIHRFERQGQSVTQTLTLVGAYGQLAYDPTYDRLYAVQEDGLQVFDGDLALLAETDLPHDLGLFTFDQGGQQLFLGDADANLLVVATGGGRLETPPAPPSTSGQPQVAAQAAGPGGTLFRVRDGRLYRSEDDGLTWELSGRGLPARPVSHLAISPDFEQDRTLLAGVSDFNLGGGLYRSIDGGETWYPATRGLTDLMVTDILFSPTFARDHSIFVTTADQGLFRSPDGGDTWVSLAHTYAQDPYHMEVRHLAVSPNFAEDRLMIIGHQNLLRSDDGGQTWVDTRVPDGPVAFSPNFSADGLILSAGHWRSTDRGQTWQPAAVGREPGEAQEILFSPSFAVDQSVYLLLRQEDRVSLQMQRSLDAGRSWTSLLNGPPAGFDIASAAWLPSGQLDLGALNGEQLRVRPETLTWGQRPIDIGQLELQALASTSDGVLFAANSAAGVLKSTDGGHSWTETGFPARAASSLRTAQLVVANDGTLFGATGTAMARSSDGGQAWSYLDGVPMGFEIASLGVSPNFAADGILLVGGTYSTNQILRSTDGGQTWETVFDADSLDLEYASDVMAIAFSPDFAADERVYAWLQDGGLLRSDDAGLSWSLVAPRNDYAQTLVSALSGDRLYLGALYGHLLVSEDGGQSWLDLGENIPDDRVWSSALAFGPGESLFLATDKGVYRSPDGGGTWTQASAGLPPRPDGEGPQGVRALAYQGGRLYAALAEGGLFVSDDQAKTWYNPATGQPASPAGQPAPATPTPQSPAPTEAKTLTPADCPAPPDHFADLWSERADQLGCPLAAQRLTMAEQSFEGGSMFWRADTAQIYVLPTGQTYSRFDDTWDENQPAYTCPDLGPSQTPPTPQRGFGKVWCSQPRVRELLGNATSQEQAFEAALQAFDAGLIFDTPRGAVYILEGQSFKWERVE